MQILLTRLYERSVEGKYIGVHVRTPFIQKLKSHFLIPTVSSL